ncbi:MAG: cobalt-precorrin-6A reductase [Amaricoccus sp.]|uniref:cobalt-precorrin-6A reductase n=1 Tax=Amaricoccus sp. TaxID=1872485 RepID=UPI0039E4400D
MTHVLILGGTGDARALATRLAGRDRLRVTYALAGRTRAPETPACDVRIGGFGGTDGLAAWIAAEDVRVLVDATHPYAARISRAAAAAARATGIPLVPLGRAAWEPRPGDRWIPAADMAAAAIALGRPPARVFLAIGRQEVAAFRAAPQHAYVIRSIEPVAPDALPPHAETLLARGPFDEAAERRLLTERRIDVLVAKNSGGGATYGKIAAARALGLPVVMVARPAADGGAGSVEAALRAVMRHVADLGE